VAARAGAQERHSPRKMLSPPGRCFFASSSAPCAAWSRESRTEARRTVLLIADSDAQRCSSRLLAETSPDAVDLPYDFGRLVFEETQGKLVAAKACAHLCSSATLPDDRAETRKKSIDLLRPVSVVERVEVVHVEEDERDPLLSGERWERGEEFSRVRQSGQAIHVQIVDAAERRSSLLGSLTGLG